VFDELDTARYSRSVDKEALFTNAAEISVVYVSFAVSDVLSHAFIVAYEVTIIAVFTVVSVGGNLGTVLGRHD
jgi:hypothetical protein